MRKGGWLVVVAFALVAAACGGDQPAVNGGDGGTAGATVDATMDEFSITLSTSSVAAGEVTFDVTNAGGQQHDFHVLRTELVADGLPVVGAAVDTSDDNIETIDVIPAYSTGTQSLTVDLLGGAYVVICNIPTHYAAGMYASFEAS